MQYDITLTIHSPHGETNYTFICGPKWTIDQALAEAIKMHPSTTSAIIRVAPNHDGPFNKD